MNNRYCKNCLRWYRDNTNQCNIPDCGISYKNKKDFNAALGRVNKFCDSEGLNFINKHLELPYTVCSSSIYKIYGQPSSLNKNNNCYFYVGLPKGLRWLTPILHIFTSF